MSEGVTVEIGPAGRMVMVEPEQRPGLDRRVFYRTALDTLEWAHFSDWREHGERARWYGFASRELPETMVSR